MQGVNDMMKAMLAAQAGGQAALSFLAGKCSQKIKDGGIWITSDKKKGQIDLVKDPQDQLWHFKWKNLMSGKQGADLILFPNTAKWYKLDYVEDGRVFELRIGSGKHWFWMQEPDESKDEETCRKLRNILKHGALEAPKKDDKKDKEANKDKAAAPPKPAVSEANQQAIMKAFMNVLNPQAQALKQTDVNIMDLFESFTMEKVLDDPAAVTDLLKHAHDKLKDADDEKIREKLKADLLSPQVQTACKTLTRVIQSGHARQLLQEMNIEKPETITARQFLEALQAKEGGPRIFEDVPKDTTDSKEPVEGDKDESKDADAADKGKENDSKGEAMDEDGK